MDEEIILTENTDEENKYDDIDTKIKDENIEENPVKEYDTLNEDVGDEKKTEETTFTSELKQEIVNEIAKQIAERVAGKNVSNIEEFKNLFSNETIKNSKKFEENDDFMQIGDDEMEKIQSKFPQLEPGFINKEIHSEEFKEFFNIHKKADIAKVYENYVGYKTKIEDLAIKKAKIMYAKRFASPGSMQSSNLTKVITWDSMNDEDFERAISDAKKGYYSKK